MKRAHNFIDLTGKKFGRLIVTKFDGIRNNKSFWKCKCKCGNDTVVYSCKLNTGHTKSCGCLFMETVTKHGESLTPFYRRWHAMMSRCGKHKNYLNIKVYKRWHKYINFKEDMYKSFLEHIKKYGWKNTTIDRINNKGNYKKSNCKWSTVKEQNNNFSRNRFYTYDGETLTVSQWYDKLKPVVSVHCFYNRIINLKWDIQKAKKTPNLHFIVTSRS